MKIQTISLCAGEGRCPRHCPYCVSRMTGKAEFSKMPEALSDKVSRPLNLAEISGVSTALITGKGEPLFTEKSRSHVMQYLDHLSTLTIPFIEIQTSGYGLTDETLESLAKYDVTTVAISCVSDSLSKNKEIFGQEYRDPFIIAERIHYYGMMVRLCCTMCSGYVESWESMEHLIQSAAMADIEQLSFVPVTAPQKSESLEAFDWVSQHRLKDNTVKSLYNKIRSRGTRLMALAHGGEVYDIDGVSVCIRYCLTNDTDYGNLRQVIVYPNGETRYSWTSRASRLVRGDAIE